MKWDYPNRIVCLTEETTETLYLLGEEARIVGISGFTVRPPRARKEKPKVSAFTSAKIDKIMALEPDLVLGFSDLQADIAAELVRLGVEVHVFNHRSIAEILRTVAMLAAMVGASAKGEALVAQLQDGMADIQTKVVSLPCRPRVYFEEWDDPMICGIRWVSELIDVAGGEDCFAAMGQSSLATGRILDGAQRVIDAAPDVIIGSWCGKKFRAERVIERPGFDVIPAVRRGHIYEIKSPLILQPGPAALTDGLREMHGIIARVAADIGASS
ncbi:MAG: cobalamin-binding protein [Gammaproteobacteria bacterium]